MNLQFRITPPAALSARLDAWLAAPPPPLAVEIAPERVVGARRQGQREAAAALRCARRPLPPEALAASPVQVNIPHREPVVAALREVLAALEGEGQEVALLVPDLAARVSILDFDTVPARRDELDALVRFRLRKTLPFDADAMALSCQVLTAAREGPRRVLVALADRARLDEYEDCVAAAGAQPVLTLPSGLAALAAHPALESGTMLLRAEPGSLTTAFCWNGEPEFFRVVATDEAPGLDDVFPSIAFFHERWEARGGSASEPGADRGAPTLFAAGLPAPLCELLRDEAPWAQLRVAEVRAADGDAAPEQLLAVAGALRGRFL